MASRRLDPALARALATGVGDVTAAVRALARAAAEGRDRAAARAALADALQRQALANLAFGARRVLAIADAARGVAQAGGIPKVPPIGAVEDLLLREPRLARTAARVSELYAEQGRWFAAARAADLTVLGRVQGVLAAALREGLTVPATTDLVKKLTQWSRSYADVVVRTNASTAYADGVMAAARDPDVAAVVVGMEIGGPVDSDARPNHREAVGWRAAVDDPRWGFLRPPLGYNAVESGTMIWTRRGKISIDGVRVGDEVMTFQGIYARVYGVDRKTETATMVKVTLDDGGSVSLASAHPVLTRRGWVSAGYLKTTDEVASVGCGGCGKPVPHERTCCDATCRNRMLSRTRARPTLDKVCEKCGSRFQTRRPTARLCSHQCVHAVLADRSRRERKCVICGKSILARGKKKGKVVCSLACRGRLAWTKPDKPCRSCGRSIREVLRQKARDDGRKKPMSRSRLFCSFRCWRRFNGETSIEKIVRLYFEANDIPYVQKEQVGRFEVDFVLPTFGVAVECDGTYWHARADVRARDARKDVLLRRSGYVVVRLSEEEIKRGDRWKERLYAVCEDRVRAARA